MAYEFRLIRFPDEWKNVTSDWLELFNRSDQPCPFYHPLFLTASVGLPAPYSPSHLVVGTQDHAMIFGLPVRIKFLGPVQVMTFYAVPMFDHLAPLDTTKGHQASREFFSGFDRMLGIRILQADHLDAEMTALLEEVRKDRYTFYKRRSFRCPYLDLPDSEDKLIGLLSGNFRSQVRRKMKLANAGSVQFRVISCAGEGTYPEALRHLYQLHENRSSAIERNSHFLDDQERAYHIRLCEAGRAYPDVIYFFELLHNDSVIASLYGYLIHDRFYFLQSGFDQAYTHYSAGVLVMYQAMLYLTRNGVRVFDYLRGADEYKFKWTRTWNNDYQVLVGSTWIGGLVVKGLRLQRSMQHSGRFAGFRDWLSGRD